MPGNRNRFIERSLGGVLSFFKESVLSDEYAVRKGLLQGIDPRVKALTFLGFIVAAMFMKDSGSLFMLYLFCLALAAVSRINILFFLKRSWMFIPLFSLFIAFPALFAQFTPGPALAVIPVFGGSLVVTRPGFESALLFVSRVLVSVSLVLLLTITTRSADLFAALAGLKVPRLFVMTLSMCYRYIFLFAGIVQDMFLAMKSRTGGLIHYRAGQHIVAWSIASLWHKSVQVNQDVYNAMLSRGFSGEARSLRGFRIRAVDLMWIGFFLIVCAALIIRMV